VLWTAACMLSNSLNDVRQHGRGPVKPPLKRARRISTPIVSSCAAGSIEVSEMTAYGKGFGCRPSASGRPGIGGRHRKASEERTRGKAESAVPSMEIWRGSGFGGRWLSQDR
jgi:hypothetical protein